ncbi:lysophospholipid acyltransferase family protein [Sedimenticola selenatireducens]|jgi:1-acyl-sn-glycerol-3-phosphate acyltransferase|uniref:1-acyl-sn-glycerol-3-phosphate acyltransferase n=1 Tax=Sedimenticola selenatireducens TaxID=191960 RepID=A0A557S030_9GAMM|nr:lysophospholipid acyltransferase family protein [Sedimenticola selenatireducens]TVO70766.1 1-acyl-sn-glycerol-3-phosphate acyltransferase [Sedimenticola selenatireducens]TVT65686.1 MAG: 1-acyl-sn-glycerol-3-phosphate acyltransferase [Sedimenticola selenatireducens]
MTSLTLVVFSLLAGLLLWQFYRLTVACRRANRVDWGRGWMNLLDGLNRLFCYRYHRLNVLGMRLPKQGPAIVVANHVSGLDPMLLLASARRPLRFIIAREEYQRYGLNWLFRAIGCIPVDREKKPEQALREALRCLRNGEVVALFPHGKIHLDSDPPRRIKAGAIRLSQITGAPIVPHHISGVRGEGGVISGVLLRSHARIKSTSPIYPEEWGREQLQALVQAVLDNKSEDLESIAN